MGEFFLPKIGKRAEELFVTPDLVLQSPLAEFTWEIVGPNTVQFTSLASDPDGLITRHKWKFGDAPARPIPSFTFSVNGFDVSFVDTSTPAPGRTIASRLWDFGDGSFATTQNPVHRYASGGTYAVKLQVTDDIGNQSLIASQQNVSVGALGRHYGAYASWESTTGLKTHTTEYNLVSTADQASSILARLAAAEAAGKSHMLTMTGGGHDQYITNGKFDINKWKARQATFFEPTIKAGINSYIDKGVVPGANMIDEPANTSASKGWGFNITRAMLDEMASYIKAQFPKLPCGIAMDHISALPGDPAVFQVVDFQMSSFLFRKGDIDDYISLGSAYFDQQGLARVWTINPINGGYKIGFFPDIVLTAAAGVGAELLQVQSLSDPLPDNSHLYFENNISKYARVKTDVLAGATSIPVDPLLVALSNGDDAIVTSACETPLTGGPGTSEVTASTNCAMTARQYKEWTIQLLDNGDGVLLWRYDSRYMALADVRQAERDIRAHADTLTRNKWSRRI